MTTWTEEKIQSLVTDSGSWRDGQKLAQISKWVSIGRDEKSAWGSIQGSGSSPYKTCIDLDDMASKCTCPSRKFPCKHAAALMMLFVRDEITQVAATPDWAMTWLEGRQRKREAAENSTPDTPKKAPDPAKQAKTEAARLKKVDAGVEELRLFLEDTVRQGLSDSRIKDYAYWDRIAARMVDAQMSPIAKRLRQLSGLAYQKNAAWVEGLAMEIARLYALTEAYLKRDALPVGLQADVLTLFGFPVKNDVVLAEQPRVADRWNIIGVVTQALDDGLIERRTWLYGDTTRRYALLLDFAHTRNPFTTNYPAGKAFEGEVAYYPSAYPLRVALSPNISPYLPIAQPYLAWPDSVDAILDEFSAALALNPFLERIPAGLQRGYITPTWLTDPTAKRLTRYPSGNRAEWYKAVIGDHWVPAFGEWDGIRLTLNSILIEDGWLCPITT